VTILQITVFIALAALVGRLRRGRQLALLAASGTAIFWLQPGEPVITLGFWLPVATLAVTVTAWALTSLPETRVWSQTWPAVAVLSLVVVSVAAGRLLRLQWTSMLGAPRLEFILMILAAAAAFVLVCNYWRSRSPALMLVFVLGLLAAFVVLKTPGIAASVESWLKNVRPATDRGEPGALLAWLGFSYVAFRILHTFRDRQSGRLPPATLAEYVNYVCFFPALTAGPIDRLDRFVPELRSPVPLQDRDWLDAGGRIVLGLFKKFVISDLLAVISISDGLVPYVRTAGWMWIFLYAYSLRIYFDFSGYTDIAIGIGRIMGVRLPENFAAPYLKSNIALFWNSWHMTLTQWFRSYVFNPLTRRLRAAKAPPPIWLIILVTQASTMVLIGLWHGIAWSFAAWGMWHAIGLFIHNRWVSLTANRLPMWVRSPGGQMVSRAVGIFLTFNFVTVGWLFFVLSSPELAWRALLRLVGSG
jgi:alginate O-acetyltransferase complex protein AlgI